MCLDISRRMMTTISTPGTNDEMVRWQFRMRNRLLTIGVARTGAAGYSVVTIPHFNVRKGTVEIYKDLVTALQRHASIASQLRADGWSIASYTTT
jgi:hypothetical protein